MTTWLVTGASGFLGRQVVGTLSRSGATTGDRIVALGRRRPDDNRTAAFVAADLLDPQGLDVALDAIRPDVVIHCAGATPPQPDPTAYDLSNRLATEHLLAGLRRLDCPVRVVLVGSAAELGPVPVAELPVGESYPAAPVEDYGRSKLAATRRGLAEGPPLAVLAARVFNPIGPGTPATNAFGRFARLLTGPGPDPLTLEVGDLAARRDFIDVRDVADALIALAARGRSGQLYHIGTGGSHAVGAGLERLIGLSGRAVTVVSSGPGPGPSDSRAAIDRIVADTGWAPRIPFERSLDDLWVEVAGDAGAA